MEQAALQETCLILERLSRRKTDARPPIREWQE
jgi:hypothetical protein